MAILNRGTLVLLGCAIALGGAVLFIENRGGGPAAQEADNGELVSQPAAAEGELMFPFAEADIESFTLSRPNETLAFSKDENGFWQMTGPQTAEAEGGAIAFLLSQLTSPAARSLFVKADTLDQFGLANPEVTINLVADGKPYQFLVGDTDFSGDRRYVQAIPQAGDNANARLETEDPAKTVTIHLVSGGLTNAINRPTAEWLVAKETQSEGASATEEGTNAASENKENATSTTEESAPSSSENAPNENAPNKNVP